MTDAKVTKISVAERIFNEVEADATIEKKRPEFMKRFKAEAGVTEACARTYYQMFKYEKDGNGKRYKHHNKKKPAVAAAPVVEAGAGDASVTGDASTSSDAAAA